MTPAAVGASGTQIEHGLVVVFSPPSPGELESFLYDVSVSTFDLPGTDGQIGDDGLCIAKLPRAVDDVAVTLAHRGIFGRNGIRLNEGAQRTDHRRQMVSLQSLLLERDHASGYPPGTPVAWGLGKNVDRRVRGVSSIFLFHIALQTDNSAAP
ncbi:MAG: hypothetical protein HY066_16680 [Betaproteobacteria bacterium]|nr:hypothetical protein [Betaproteobacteria bacterium]